jgi:hypothetical protein
MEPKNINMYCQIMNVIIIIYQFFNMNVKGVNKLHSFWAYKPKNRPLDIWGFEF